jgi:NADPH2:quinone reductase
VMRALRRTAPGTIELCEIPEAEAAEGEILVDVLYSSVNPFDVQVMRGEIGRDASRPLTLGAECTGLVDGELVFVSGGLGADRDGTHSERVSVPPGSVRRLPRRADARKVATVGVAGGTAWRAVHQLAEVTAKDVVLVLGASGGVGSFAAQLAVATGARVLAQTADAQKAERLTALGLEGLVADTPERLTEAVRASDVSVVLDPLGGDYVSGLLSVLRPRARVVTYGVLAGRSTTLDLAKLYGAGLRILGTSGGSTPPGEREAALSAAMDSVLTDEVVVMDEVLPLDRGLEAFARLQARDFCGKLLLQP